MSINAQVNLSASGAPVKNAAHGLEADTKRLYEA